MTKRKTKLVCVGWGIVWLNPPFGLSWYTCKPTRRESIEVFDEQHSDPDYREYRRKGFAIAKKLWV